MPYSNDADPEYEGISVRLSYYDSKSNPIIPSGVSVEVTVELYWYTNHPSIYQKQVTINHRVVRVVPVPFYSSKVVSIPYEDIQAKPSAMTRGPILILTVNTPTQGIFEVQYTIPGFLWP